MIKASIDLQDLRRRLYVKAKAEPSWQNARASVGSGGVGDGCTKLWGCSTATGFVGLCRKSPRLDRSHKPWIVKQAGERSAGKPHAAFDEAGTGNAVRSRCCDTRNRKGEPTGNTNFDLTWRASPRPYLGAPGGETPSGDSPIASICRTDANQRQPDS
jgi:hypothetical protein